MRKLGIFYRYIQILSIDIVIGAVLLLRFYSYRFQVQVPLEVFTLLAISVWFVYTLDHLQDSKKSIASGRVRLVFHKRNADLLRTIMVILLVLFVYCLVQLENLHLWIGGLIFGTLSLVFVLFQKQIARVGLKEVFVACVYSGGILLAPSVLSYSFLIIDFIMLSLVALINLLFFSFFESQEDRIDGFDSFVTRLGLDFSERILLVLLVLSLSLFITFRAHPFYFFATVVYGLFWLFPDFFSKNERFRIVGDSVFFLPILWDWV